jgi:hypothetical protein
MINTQDLKSNLEIQSELSIDVDATTSYSSAVDISNSNALMGIFNARTLTGTYVMPDKIKASMVNTFSGEETTFDFADAFALDTQTSLKVTAASSGVLGSTEEKAFRIHDVICKFKFIKVGLIGDAANNVVDLHVIKGRLTNLPSGVTF